MTYLFTSERQLPVIAKIVTINRHFIWNGRLRHGHRPVQPFEA